MQYRQPQYSQPPVYQSQPVQNVRRRKRRRPIVLPVLISIIAVLLLAVGIGFACDYLYTEYEKRTHPLEYTSIVQRASAEFGVPEYVIYAVIKTESSFRADAVSYRGAVGLMQIMPETFMWIADLKDADVQESEIFNPLVNMDYGCYYLRYLTDHYEDLYTACAAYNAGGIVQSWLSDPQYSTDGVTLYSIPYEETSQYVDKIRHAEEMYEKLYFSETQP